MRWLEKMQICAGVNPVDLQSGANNGDWISLKNYNHLVVVLYKAAGTAGDDPTLTLQQATDVSGTGAKALNFTRVDTKQGASLFAIGTFTKVTQAAGNTYTDDTSAEVQAIWVVEIDAQDLDRDNGFDCVRATVADVGGNAQLGCLFYLLFEARYAGEPAVSAIVD